MSTASPTNGRIHIYPDNMTELNELLGINVEELFPMIYPTALTPTKTLEPSERSQQENQNSYLSCLQQANSASTPYLIDNHHSSLVKIQKESTQEKPTENGSAAHNDEKLGRNIDNTQKIPLSSSTNTVDLSSHKPQKAKLRASSRQLTVDHLDELVKTPSYISSGDASVDSLPSSHSTNSGKSGLHVSVVKTNEDDDPEATTPPVTPAHSSSRDSHEVNTPRQQSQDELGPHGIIIKRQNTSNWGQFRIDRFGNFIAEPTPGEVPGSPNGIDTQDFASSQSASRVSSTHGHLRSVLPDHKSKERNKEREKKWVQMLQQWHEFSTRKESKLKERIRKGIPPSARGAVWPLIMKINDIRSRYPQDYYRTLLEQDILPEHDQQIRKDLPRLLQNHILFRSPEGGSRVIFSPGQATLYNVLKAYSIHDPDVGYVQGMDTLAAPALMYFPEELTFWYLERLLNSKKYGLRYNYIDGFPLAHQYVWVHERLVQRHLPKLYKAMEKASVQHTGYAFRWYTMRYAQFAPELSFRILDIYLYEGDKILYRVALALLKQRINRLISDPDSMIEVLMDIENDSESHQAEPLINSALKIDITTEEIRMLEREYQASMKIKIDRY